MVANIPRPDSAAGRSHPVPRRFSLLLAIFMAIAMLVSLLAPAGRTSANGFTTETGKIAGADYVIEKPVNWNHILLLYSHGYAPPGDPNQAPDLALIPMGQYLLAQGFALAGTSYGSTGWAVADAIPTQMAVLQHFKDENPGETFKTIAWGHSLGGLVTAGLIQNYPESFDGALEMCGAVAGGIANWNVALDSQFAFQTLIAPAMGLRLVHIAFDPNDPSYQGVDPNTNAGMAIYALDLAQQTPEGRAKIALVAALSDLPGWADPRLPEPAATDYATRELNQYFWLRNVGIPFGFALRAEMEYRAGGNPSWNTGVNYNQQFGNSINNAEVQALYAAAGLSLDQDMKALRDAPRISADPWAVEYMKKNISFNGDIRVPVLTMHTTGDGFVGVQNEQAYASAVRKAGNNPLLRQTYVNRAGHCTFTQAETLAALDTLLQRINTGSWEANGGSITDPSVMNAKATALGAYIPALTYIVSDPNIGPFPADPSFITYEPAKFLRPYNLNDIPRSANHR